MKLRGTEDDQGPGSPRLARDAEDLDPYLSGCSLGMKNVAPVRLLAPVGDVLTLQSAERVGDVT